MSDNPRFHSRHESKCQRLYPDKRRLVFRAAAVFFGVLFSLITIEIGLRILTNRGATQAPVAQGYDLIHERAVDPELIYQLAPNTEKIRESVRYVINSDGFRDDEFPRPLPAEARRILVLGDSVAFGWRVSQDEAFPQRLESILNSIPGGGGTASNTIIYNLAVDGYSTRQEVRMLETAGLKFHPDLVILSYILNDPDVADGGLSRYYSAPRIEILRRLADATFEIRQRFDSGPTRAIGREYHNYVHDRYADDIKANFENLGRLVRHNRLRLLVLIIPSFGWPRNAPYPFTDIHKQITDLSIAQGFDVLDLQSDFETSIFAEIAFDEFHPRPAGHDIIARKLASRLIPGSP